MVQRTFEPENNVVYYADTREQAEQFQDALTKPYQTDFVIFEQPLLDPRERPIVTTGGPVSMLVEGDGKLVMMHVTKTHEPTKHKDERRMYRFEVPEGVSQEEATIAVRKAFEAREVSVG